MTTAWQKPRPGFALAAFFTRRFCEALVDTVVYVEKLRFRNGAGERTWPALLPGQVWIQNTSSSDRKPGEVLSVSGVAISDAENLTEFQKVPPLIGATPTWPPSTPGGFVICADAIPCNQFGRAWLSGVMTCQVQVNPGLDWYGSADVIPGDCTQLILQPWGAAQVLWKAPASGGYSAGQNTVQAVVRLGPPSGLSSLRATLTGQLFPNNSAGFTVDGMSSSWADTVYDVYLGPGDSLPSGGKIRVWWELLARQWIAVNTNCPS